MAQMKIRYFVEKPGRLGPRYFWQPDAKLRTAGWRPERLPDDRAAAIARAEVLNQGLDDWRSGTPPAHAQTPGAVKPAILRHAVPGSFADLVRRYKASRFYKERAPATRAFYDYLMRGLEIWAEETPVAAIGPKNVEKLYVGLREKTPTKARAMVTMLRVLLAFAVKEAIVRTNAASHPGLVGAQPTGRLWPRAAVLEFVKAADALGWHSIGTAVMIGHWIGQRQADILELKRSDYRDGSFFVEQNKTDARVAVPDSLAVAARIEAELGRQRARAALLKDDLARERWLRANDGGLLLCETTGRPWQSYYFRHCFADVRARLVETHPEFAMPDGSKIDTSKLWFMHLRHTAVTELAIAGCTLPQIAAITGHTLKGVEQILNRYLIRTSELAASAMKLRVAQEEAK